MKNNQLATIYIVRHGESEYNILRSEDDFKPEQWGAGGAPLTKNGEKQVRERAEHLKYIHFDAIFSSDVTRAIRTAELIKLERDLAINTTSAIRERLTYKLPGKTFKDTANIIKKELKLLDEEAKLAYKPIRNFESANDTATRLLLFLREIAVAYINKTVLVINHGNNMRALLQHLGYVSYNQLPEHSIENTSYIILQSDGVDFFVKETKGINIQK